VERHSSLEKKSKQSSARENNPFLQPLKDTSLATTTTTTTFSPPPSPPTPSLSSSLSSSSLSDSQTHKNRVSFAIPLRQSSASNLSTSANNDNRKTPTESNTSSNTAIHSPKTPSHREKTTSVKNKDNTSQTKPSLEKTRSTSNTQEKKIHHSHKNKENTRKKKSSKTKTSSRGRSDERSKLMRSCDAIMPSRVHSSIKIEMNETIPQPNAGSSEKLNAEASVLNSDAIQQEPLTKNEEFKMQRQLRWKQRRRSFDLGTLSDLPKSNVVGPREIRKSALFQEELQQEQNEQEQVQEEGEEVQQSQQRKKAFSLSESLSKSKRIKDASNTPKISPVKIIQK
jgi:hypothetical protein